MVTSPAVWWVILAVKPATGSTKPAFAFVVGPLTVAQAQAKYGSGLNNGVNPAGGFTTKAAADAAAAKFNKNPPNFGVDAPSVLPGSFPNPLNLLAGLSWLEEIGHWIGVFVAAVTDPYLWISLGWGFLGLVLLIVGILWWFKSTEAGQKLGKAAGEAAVVAA